MSAETDNPPFAAGKVGIASRDEELWGAASMLLKRRGAQAVDHADDRAKELATAGEIEGAALWRQLAERVRALAANSRTTN